MKIRIALSIVLGMGVFFGSTAFSHINSVLCEDAGSIQNNSEADVTASANGLIETVYSDLSQMPSTTAKAVNPVKILSYRSDKEDSLQLSIADEQDIYLSIENGTIKHIEESRYVLYDNKDAINSRRAGGYSTAEKKLIARVVYAESRGEIFEGQVAVASVVLNRYESGRFGSSISRVAFAPNQFAITEKYNATSLKAVEAAIANRDAYPKNLFFFQVSKRRTWRNFVYYKRIGNHTFFCSAN